MKKYVYMYCAMFLNGSTQSYKNGFFESEEISSVKDGLNISAQIKEALEIKSDNFILISLNKLGEVK